MGVTSVRNHVLGLMLLSEECASLNGVCSTFMDCDVDHNLLNCSQKMEISHSTYDVDHMPMAYGYNDNDQSICSSDSKGQDQKKDQN